MEHTFNFALSVLMDQTLHQLQSEDADVCFTAGCTDTLELETHIAFRNQLKTLTSVDCCLQEPLVHVLFSVILVKIAIHLCKLLRGILFLENIWKPVTFRKIMQTRLRTQWEFLGLKHMTVKIKDGECLK